MKKIKVLSAVLAMIMLISCFPFTALADGEKRGEKPCGMQVSTF